MATIIVTIFFSVLPIFHIHSIVSAMFCVSICEKQLLKLFMDLSVDYSGQTSPKELVPDKDHPLSFTDKIG